MQKIKKAVIPAAGLGTRFLPATKSIPKEMLPLVDKPTLLYVVEEAVAAGIEDIVIIAGRGKTAIENFFDTNYELEDVLNQQGKTEILKSLRAISNMANIISVRQKEAKGLGHAVYCSKPVVGNESFAVLLGDEITFPNNGYNYITKELIDLYGEQQTSAINVIEVEKESVHKYGIIDYQDKGSKYKNLPILEVRNIIEKPSCDEAPSHFALPGRYVFNKEIFAHLEETTPGKNGEIQLTDAMVRLLKKKPIAAINIPNRRYDAGDKLGFLIANIELALQHEDIGEHLKNYLESLHLDNNL